MAISFIVPLHSRARILRIAKWAVEEYERIGISKRSRPTLLDIEMDLTACHANGCPLNLDRMIDATREDAGSPLHFSLWHDVTGIHRHLNRETGKLEDCFMPRLALK